VWSREIDGLVLTFHLAGINNQNFLMRDEETGTYWQQISGAAISGPLAGRHLTLVFSDELTFATWRAEQPQGLVLQDVGAFASKYSKKDWDVRMQRTPVVIDFPEQGRKPRDLMLGVESAGAARAFLYDRVLHEKLVKDHIGPDPILLVVGDDNSSVRAFRDRIPGVPGAPDFYRYYGEIGLMMDAPTGSRWNFQGCAVFGKLTGTCLERIPMLKDYWFDWRNYHPQTTVWQ
jgi:hypothetical protein